MSLYPTKDDWKGAEPVFFLEIDWGGRVYRPSTKPLILQSANGFIQLQGGMIEDPDFTEELPELGFNVNSYSTAIATHLLDVNIAKQHEQNNRLENSSAKLFYLLVKQDSQQAYEQSIKLLEGVIKEPVFAHRDKHEGYVELSIESEVLEVSFHNLAVGSGARISAEDLSDLVNPTLSPLSAIQNADFILSTLELHKGKILPIIFGAPGLDYDVDYNVIKYPATPAYIIWATHGGSNQIWLALSPHDVQATTVRIFDDLGNNRVETVQKWIRRDGRIFTFVEFTHGTGTFQNPVIDETARYFVSWEGGGGLISPSNKEEITGGGDICLYCLSQGDQKVDYASWEALRLYLNQYKFAGYINNQDITPLEFLENEIIPFLPISVIQGLEGIRPVLDILASGSIPVPILSITADNEFTSQGGIQRRGDTSSIINEYTLEYGFDMKSSEFRNRMTVTGDTSLMTNQIMSNTIAQSSFNQYGSRKNKESAAFIADFNTASLVCFDKIRQSALPNDYIEYLAAARFGYLQIGDILSLTDVDLSFQDRVMQIISKSWKGQYWLIKLKAALQEVS